MLDGVFVHSSRDAKGNVDSVPLSSLAQVFSKDAATLMVKVFDESVTPKARIQMLVLPHTICSSI